ncbi:hypothetical protein JXQ70_14755 [bacterium]|nr:hypothetical protein [bacterium]
MKKQTMLIGVFLLLVLPYLLGAEEVSDQATQVLNRYFEASGGIEHIRKIANISFTAQYEGYEYAVNYLITAAGPFRINEPGQTVVFDGKDYWQTYFGLVNPVPADQLEPYREITLLTMLFNGLLDASGQPVKAEYLGQEEKHGQHYDLVKVSGTHGGERTCYFNRSTGLLEKIIELVDDPELVQLKNISRFSDYQKFDGLTLFTSTETMCVTNGISTRPPTRLLDIKLNQDLDSVQLIKPEATVEPASFKENVITAKIIGFSRGGSAITNITQEVFANFVAKDEATFTVEIKGTAKEYKYLVDINAALSIGRGDYLVVFNNTPALWLVKAFLGLRPELEGVSEGEPVTIKPALIQAPQTDAVEKTETEATKEANNQEATHE